MKYIVKQILEPDYGCEERPDNYVAMDNKTNEIVLFETSDGVIKLSVPVVDETVWLNRNQMADLFGRDVKTIGKHIGNALKEELDN